MIKGRSPMSTPKYSVPTYIRLTSRQLKRLKSAVRRGDYMTISEAVRAAVTSMLRGSKRKAQQQQAASDLTKRIDKQFKKGEVTRQGITFRKDSIECEGIIVRNDKIGGFIMLNKVHLQQEPEFRKIVQDFVFTF